LTIRGGWDGSEEARFFCQSGNVAQFHRPDLEKASFSGRDLPVGECSKGRKSVKLLPETFRFAKLFGLLFGLVRDTPKILSFLAGEACHQKNVSVNQIGRLEFSNPDGCREGTRQQ
jgi:hypothetical protein